MAFPNVKCLSIIWCLLFLKKNVHFSYIIQSLYRPLKRSVACESSSDSKCLLPFQLSHFVWLDINILHVGSSTWIPNTHSRIEGDFFRTTCGVAPLKWQYIYAWYLSGTYEYYQYYVIAIADDFSSHFRAWNLKVQTWCFHTKSYVTPKHIIWLGPYWLSEI